MRLRMAHKKRKRLNERTEWERQIKRIIDNRPGYLADAPPRPAAPVVTATSNSMKIAISADAARRGEFVGFGMSEQNESTKHIIFDAEPNEPADILQLKPLDVEKRAFRWIDEDEILDAEII